MRLHVPILFCGSMLLAGCQLFNGPAHTMPGERMQGTLALTADGWQLIPCNSSTPLSLVFAEQWREALAQCTPEQASSCFADLAVQPQSMQVSHVHRIQAEGRACNDDEFAHLQLRAFGNEPFWSIRLNSQGLVLQQPGLPAVALPYIQEQLGNGGQYISSQADHQTLQLWISQQPCIDSMSGNWHALSARLDWQGQTLNGCAYYGAQHAPAP